MKLTKIISSGRALWESFRRSQCNNDQNKQNTKRKLEGEKNKLSKLKTRSDSQSKNVLRHDAAGVGEKSLAVNQVNILKANVIDREIKHENGIDKKQCKENIDYNDNKKIRKISSNSFFRRKFSKYNDVGHKLDAKFQSSYKNCGHFDRSWTKYKAYVNKNQNEKNKSYLKYAVCSSGSYGDSKKKKRTVHACTDLPGKGTYNHRIAYDEALQLHRKGIDVDVLYKVKNNKSGSIYVINGEFLQGQYKLISQSNKHKSGLTVNNINQNKIDNENIKKEKQNLTEEEALWLAELAKIQKDKEIQKNRLAEIASIHREKAEREKKIKLEKFLRNRKIKEAEKEFRARQLRKIARAKMLSEKQREQEANNHKLSHQVDTNQQNIGLQEKLDHRTEMKRLRRLKLQQNLLAYKNYKNTIGNPLDMKSGNAEGEHEVIVDPDVMNDIERWALHNDGTVSAVSWLKIVAGRIDSLDGRVSQSCKNKWMRLAIDEVVDVMTAKQLSKVYSKRDIGHRKSMCKKIAKVSSSFVIKTKRTAVRCQQKHSITVHKSPKFSVCPGRGNKIYKLIKTTEGSYFQVISVDAFGLCGAKERTNC